MTRGLRTAAPGACRRKGARQLTKAICNGLDAVVCVRLKDATYEGPTRSKLATPAVATAVSACIAEAFSAFLRDHEDLLTRFTSDLGVAD